MGGFIRQYAWVVDLVGILLGSFFLAKITGVYLGRAMEVKRSIGVLKPAEVLPFDRKQADVAEYQVIGERDIFNSADRAVDSSASATGGVPLPEVQSGEAVKTSLGISVLGVLVVGDGRDSRSTATVSGGGGGKEKGAAAVYAVGDKESFAPATLLVRVQPSRIEFMNNGRLEFAEVASDFGPDIFGPPKPEATVAAKEPDQKTTKGPLVKAESSGKFSIDQREIEEALQNLDRLYTDIRAVPNFSGGKVSGMKILSIRGDSLFAKLGLRRGDILQKINGVELDVKRGFEIFNQLKDQKNINLDLIRGGAPTTIEYEIK